MEVNQRLSSFSSIRLSFENLLSLFSKFLLVGISLKTTKNGHKGRGVDLHRVPLPGHRVGLAVTIALEWIPVGNSCNYTFSQWLQQFGLYSRCAATLLEHASDSSRGGSSWKNATLSVRPWRSAPAYHPIIDVVRQFASRFFFLSISVVLFSWSIKKPSSGKRLPRTPSCQWENPAMKQTWPRIRKC